MSQQRKRTRQSEANARPPISSTGDSGILMLILEELRALRSEFQASMGCINQHGLNS